MWCGVRRWIVQTKSENSRDETSDSIVNSEEKRIMSEHRLAYHSNSLRGELDKVCKQYKVQRTRCILQRGNLCR